MKRCTTRCSKLCLWCVLQAAGLPLEHGMWEWTGASRFLPLIGLHI